MVISFLGIIRKIKECYSSLFEKSEANWCLNSGASFSQASAYQEDTYFFIFISTVVMTLKDNAIPCNPVGVACSLWDITGHVLSVFLLSHVAMCSSSFIAALRKLTGLWGSVTSLTSSDLPRYVRTSRYLQDFRDALILCLEMFITNPSLCPSDFLEFCIFAYVFSNVCCFLPRCSVSEFLLLWVPGLK